VLPLKIRNRGECLNFEECVSLSYNSMRKRCLTSVNHASPICVLSIIYRSPVCTETTYLSLRTPTCNYRVFCPLLWLYLRQPGPSPRRRRRPEQMMSTSRPNVKLSAGQSSNRALLRLRRLHHRLRASWLVRSLPQHLPRLHPLKEDSRHLHRNRRLHRDQICSRPVLIAFPSSLECRRATPLLPSRL
jgi:hypothetical protein